MRVHHRRHLLNTDNRSADMTIDERELGRLLRESTLVSLCDYLVRALAAAWSESRTREMALWLLRG